MGEEASVPAGAPIGARFQAARRADRANPAWSFETGWSQAAAVVAEAAADAELLALLEEECDGRTTPDEGLLVELVAATDRLQNHLAGVQATFVEELLERRRGSMGVSRTRDELALRLATTGYAAETVVARAGALAGAPDVAEAVRRGCLSPRKADLITEATDELGLAQARAVQQHAVVFGADHTVPQLRRELEAAVLAVDPAEAERAREKAVARRRVVREPARHGMEWVSALLPAEAAACVYTAVDGLAADGAADDERTVDQRRADAFTGVFEEILATGATVGGVVVPDRQGRRPVVRVSVTEPVLAGDEQSPAVLHGYGPITAATARRLAAGGVLEQSRYGGTGPPGAGGTGPPGGAARRGLFDPMNEVLPPARAPGVPDGTDPERLVNWVHARLEWVRRRTGGGGARHSNTDTADTTDTAAAGAGDPLTVMVGELGLVACDSYAPSRRLRDLVTGRDQTCRFPGCMVPAWRCQLDHIVPFDPQVPAWAQTVETNLQCLCAHHHQGKTERVFSVERDSRSGITTWRTRTGHVYTRLPERVDLSALTVQLRRDAAAIWTGEDVDDVFWWDDPPEDMTPPPVHLLDERDILPGGDVLEEITNQRGNAA
ncbi:protein of unknown function [Ruania alba]|uniref:DUF222 domain-containing protein n=2 Tax=Ruania alba TaxID=648782 RepID=A0A1H5EQB0_9MICO|nr:protein of unknown function [Ruania alba]